MKLTQPPDGMTTPEPHQEAATAKHEKPRILYLEDSPSDVALVQDALERGGLPCIMANARNRKDFETMVQQGKYDLILCDQRLPGYTGFEALAFAKHHQPHTPVIILSGVLDDAQAVASLHSGAADYVLKDRMARLVPAIRRAMREAQERIKQAAAQERIREQANLLNLTRDAIIVRNMDDKIVYWNLAAEILFGWSGDQALGQDFTELLLADRVLLDEAKGTLVQSGDWMGEMQLTGKEGGEITVMSRWNLVRNEDGKPRAILTSNTDLTERKKLEAVVFRAQRMETIGALAGGIAHDLNNALSPVLLGAGLMEGCKDEAIRKHYLSTIVSSAQRGANMLKQILNFAREPGLRTGPVSVGDQLREMAKMVRDTFPKSIEVVVDLPGKKLWTIQGDPTELHQVLLNLCVNARDAMPQGGRLTLTAQNANLDPVSAERLRGQPGLSVMITISDTGGGIPPEALPRIFQPFFTTKPVDQGTGLGLAIVAAIMQNYRGCVDVHTEAGKGTEFRLYFPANEFSEAIEAPSENAPLPLGHGELILLMEDEEAVRELTKTSLENFGYRVVTATNGAHGLNRFGEYQEKIRAVVSDTDMPVMNGLTTVRAIKNIRPDLPVIIASGSRLSSEELQRMRGENMTILGKPYTLEQLLVGVAAAMRE